MINNLENLKSKLKLMKSGGLLSVKMMDLINELQAKGYKTDLRGKVNEMAALLKEGGPATVLAGQLIDIYKNNPDILKGDKGDQGSPGDRGEAITGPRGLIGPQGPKGLQGEKGDSVKGKKGDPGSAGPVGKTGPRGLDGKSGRDGKDGIDGLDGSPDKPKDIVKKLESLKDENRLDAKAIRNLPELVRQLPTISLFPGGSSGVKEIVGGTNITVEKTDSGKYTINGSGGAETDPVFLASPAAGIVAGDIINWNTAFGWGAPITDHSNLTNLAWSVAGHTIDTNFDLGVANNILGGALASGVMIKVSSNVVELRNRADGTYTNLYCSSIYPDGSLIMGDNKHAYFGAGYEGDIYSDGTDLHIQNDISNTDIALDFISGGVAKSLLIDASANLFNLGDTALTTTGIITAKKYIVDNIIGAVSYDNQQNDLSLTLTANDIGVTYRGVFSDFDYTVNNAGAVSMPTIKWLDLDFDLLNTASIVCAPTLISGISMDMNIPSAVAVTTLQGLDINVNKLASNFIDITGSGTEVTSSGFFYVGATNTSAVGVVAARTAGIITNNNNAVSAIGYQGYGQNSDISGRATAIGVQGFINSSGGCLNNYLMQPTVTGTTHAYERSAIFTLHTGGYHILNSASSLFVTHTSRANLRMFGAITFGGAGLNDMSLHGGFNAFVTTNYKVEIDGTGATDTFKWSDDGGSTWDATGVAITASATTPQTLNNNVKIRFLAKTGHTSGNSWSFTATPIFDHLTPSAAGGGEFYAEGASEFDGVAYFDNATTALQVGKGAAGIDYRILFDGETNDGILTWMEDEDYFKFSDDIFMLGGENIVLDTSTGTKIGTATSQLLGFYNATPVNQPDTIADPSGGLVTDTEARTAINALIDRLQELGLIST
jgi:hypothetical protein